jgi:hypothetical protein
LVISAVAEPFIGANLIAFSTPLSLDITLLEGSLITTALILFLRNSTAVFNSAISLSLSAFVLLMLLMFVH